jgi:adenosylcobinamide-phosphate synthase
MAAAALALVSGYAADRLLGDPARFHPVAGFGCIGTALERRLWRPTRLAGVLYTVSLVGGVAVATRLAERALPSRLRVIFRVLAVWAALGGRSLERAARALADAVEEGDIARARTLAPTLVGRDPSKLDGPELCRAALESVAENVSDAVVAPLLWAALLGAPGVAAYRAANTLDAMVGHRSERHLRFGWASARLDDLVNWPAARLAAFAAIGWAPVVGGDRRTAWSVASRDGAAHPSPNAGRIEGAFAGALGVRLGGLNQYEHGFERRPDLGYGPPPSTADIGRAVRLAKLIGGSTVALCALIAWGRGG